MSAFEDHLSIKDIAKLWGFSVGRVRSLFRDRADVIHLGHNETLDKRCYVNIRVPKHVVEKVYADLLKGKPR